MTTYTAKIYSSGLVLQHTTTNVVAASGTWRKNGVGRGSMTFPGQDETTATETTRGRICHVYGTRSGVTQVVALFNIEERTFSLNEQGEELVTISGTGFEDRIGRHLINGEIHDGSHGPATDDIEQIMAFQPGWSLHASSPTGTTNGTRHTFKNATVLQALQAAAEQSGEMWRLYNIATISREIIWMTVPSGSLSYNFTLYFDSSQFTDESSEGVILRLDRGYDQTETVTRAYVYGAGTGDDRLTMLGATYTPPAGYSLYDGASLLVNDTLETAGDYNEREVTFSDVSLPELTFSIVYASADNDFFRVRGDHTTLFASGYAFDVEDSTGNDGSWTTDSSSYDDEEDWTTINVTGDITDITADGYIVPTSTTVSAAQEAAANALGKAAYYWLRDRTGSERYHRIRAIFHRNARCGDKVRIVYANGRVDIDEVHQVVEVTFSIDRTTGIRYMDLVTAPLDTLRPAPTEETVANKLMATMQHLLRYGAGSTVSSGEILPTMAEHLAAQDPHPTYLLADGGRTLTGNLTVSAGITIDGVDLSAHAAADDAHHDPATAGNGLSITGQELRLTQPGSLSDTSTNSPSGNHTHAIDATIARSAITITAGLGLTGGGNLTANRTLNVGAGDGIDVLGDSVAVDVTDLIGSGLTEEATNNIALPLPGTLSVSTSNDRSSNHTHAITASADPGAAASLLKTSATGLLQLNSLYSSGGAFQADNYVSQLTGWQVDYDGSADFRYIFTDELHAKAFIADIEQALAGGEIVSKSVALLSRDFTVPYQGDIANVDATNNYVAVDGDQTSVISAGYSFNIAGSTGNDGAYTVDAVVWNGSRTQIYTVEDITDSTVDGEVRFKRSIYVEDLPGFADTAVFAANDRIRLRVLDRSGGGLVIADVWGKVNVYSDLSGGEQYWLFTCTDAGGVAGDTVYAGSIVLDYGQSGDGYWEVTALDSDGPYSQIVTWTTDPSVSGNHTLKTRLGNLDGVIDTDLSPSGFGLYSDNAFLRGSLYVDGTVTAGNDTITLDTTGLFAVVSSVNALSVFSSAQTFNSESMGAGDMLIGDNSASKANVLWDKSAGQLLFRGGTTTQAYIDTDGAIVAGGGDVNIDSSGIRLDALQGKYSSAAIEWESGASTYLSVGTQVDLGSVIGAYIEAGATALNLTSDSGYPINIYGGSVKLAGPTGGDGTITIVGDLAVNTNALAVDAATDYVGIGTASPSFPLDAKESASGYVARFFNDGNASTRNGIVIQAGEDSNPSHYAITFRDGDGTTIGVVVGDGAGGVNYNSSSDAATKDDVRSLESALAAVNRLRPVSYRGRGAPPAHARAVGLVAQEVQAHVPEAVSEIDDGLLGIDYSRLVPHLIGAVQELSSRIEQLEAA